MAAIQLHDECIVQSMALGSHLNQLAKIRVFKVRQFGVTTKFCGIGIVPDGAFTVIWRMLEDVLSILIVAWNSGSAYLWVIHLKPIISFEQMRMRQNGNNLDSAN